MMRLEPTDIFWVNTLWHTKPPVTDRQTVQAIETDRLRAVLQDHLKNCKILFLDEVQIICPVCNFIKEGFGVVLK